MTFGEYILQLRERLNDMRKSDASLIVLPSEDGVRWTSAKLINIANNALLEVSRMIGVYSRTPFFTQLSGNFEGVIVPHVIEATGLETNGIIKSVSLPPSVLVINEALLADGEGIDYIKPSKFLTFQNDVEELGRPDKLYTVMYDVDTTTKKFYVIGHSTGDIRITYLYSKFDYAIEDIDVEIFLKGIDDLLLDVAEREGRDREHNETRSQILEARIFSKLGIAANARN